MRSLFDSFYILPARQDINISVRARAGDRARRIASALLGAELAGHELAMTADALERAKLSGAVKAIAAREAKLELAKRAHLRECATLALEMQRGIADALGDWVLSDDTAGTGLSRQELSLILDVTGARQ